MGSGPSSSIGIPTTVSHSGQIHRKRSVISVQLVSNGAGTISRSFPDRDVEPHGVVHEVGLFDREVVLPEEIDELPWESILVFPSTSIVLLEVCHEIQHNVSAIVADLC